MKDPIRPGGHHVPGWRPLVSGRQAARGCWVKEQQQLGMAGLEGASEGAFAEATQAGGIRISVGVATWLGDWFS